MAFNKRLWLHAAEWFEGIVAGTEQPEVPSYGLCSNIHLHLKRTFDVNKYHLDTIWHVIQLQAKQGDDPSYPIEGSEEAYYANQDKYNPETEFGARRLEVARTVARILRNMEY